jgi:enoyl-CoA hydratase/carnithine racemase
MPVRFERPPDHPHVALVTLDRPQKANALDPEMLCDLAAAWREIAGDDALRCAVLTGAGSRVFCAGMDMTSTIPIAQALARGEQIDPAASRGCGAHRRRCWLASIWGSLSSVRSTGTPARVAST